MKTKLITTATIIAASLAFASVSLAHCDSMDGPVVKDAQRAIAAKDITPILKWISPEDQAEVSRVFQTTIDIRSKGDEVQKVADTHFFETLVRIHRKSEGEGFTGLKPAGNAEPPIVAADKALSDGDIDKCVPTSRTEEQSRSCSTQEDLANQRPNRVPVTDS